MRRAIPRPSNPRDEANSRLAWQRLIARRGTRAIVARELNLRWQTPSKWTVVPLDYVFQVARITRTLPEDLRPDFFRHDPLRSAAFVAPRVRGIPPAPNFSALEAHGRAVLTSR